MNLSLEYVTSTADGPRIKFLSERAGAFAAAPVAGSPVSPIMFESSPRAPPSRPFTVAPTPHISAAKQHCQLSIPSDVNYG
jgi:hypothetical protein